MEELKLEKENLDKTIKTVKEILEYEQSDLADLYKNFHGDREELWRIAERKKIHINNLNSSLDKPYFARLDFTDNIDGVKHVIYIGKNGISKGSKIIVTDWRAPISSLYYDAELGECSYKVPEGIISGKMSLKRQYEIEKGELLKFFDVDLVSNDALLQKYLNDNNDNRLKSIVSTIQKEQNEVIRKDLFDNLIVQGVAGSGKTTVALHRIAYLVYNYMNQINQNQYLVIGPNPVFIKYIKSVLPELDVSGVTQLTFEMFAKEYIDEDIIINSSNKKVNDNISGKSKNDIDKFKSSLKYKNMLEKFIEVYFYTITCNDLKIGNFKVLDSNIIRDVFNEVNASSSSSLENKIQLVIEKLCKYIEETNSSIISRYDDYTYEIFKQVTNQKEREKLRTVFSKERSEIKKNCKTIIRKYFSKAKANPTQLYKLFISSIEEFDLYKYSNLQLLKKEAITNIKKNIYEFEDLSALMYIKQRISPDRKYLMIRHTVVDEAQDLGEFNFFVLKSILPKATFSIFGDLAQSIYDYRGINNWEQVNSIMFNNDGEIVKFKKSYRTTAEIMNIADDVAECINMERSDLVVRHGTPVKYTDIGIKKCIPEYMIKKIMEYKQKGYKTIAIISKTEAMSKNINLILKEFGLDIPDITVDDDLTKEEFRICTISNQLAKGLEFDAVIINNASEEIYSSESTLDMKLLYVAITRALHEIDIMYTGYLTKPLKQNASKSLRR